jgi:hypothetical protein
MRLFVLLLALLVSGCSAPQYKLGPEWEPLEKIVERDLPLVSDTAVTTIGKTLYTTDLKKFLARDAREVHGVLLHEQEHSRRQLDVGTLPWMWNYLINSDFRWEEEKAGWKLQIQFCDMMGLRHSSEYYASILSNDGYDMVSYNEALEWVKSLRR